MITIDKYGKYLQMQNCINSKTGLLKTGFFRLDFSEKQQHFHLNRGTHAEYTHGWNTVCKIGEDLHLSKFIDYMKWKYKFNRKKPIKLKTVLREFECYECIVESTKRYK